MKKKEIYWLLGTFGIVMTLTILLFGVDAFNADSTLDINIHDTYFVIANLHFILLISGLTFFGVYFFRAIKRNFKNLTANLVLIIAMIFLIMVLYKTISILDIFSQPINITENPPINGERGSVQDLMSIFSKILLVLQIGLLILLAYCGFKTGLNYKSEK